MFSFKQLFLGIILTLMAEVGLYVVVFSNFEVVDYAFLWAACLVFTFLLKLFNVGPAKGPLNTGRNATDAYTSLSLSFLEKHFEFKHRRQVSDADEDKRVLIKYAVLIAINGCVVYFLG